MTTSNPSPAARVMAAGSSGAHELIGPQRRRQVERTLANIADGEMGRSVVVERTKPMSWPNGTSTRHQHALASDAPCLADAVDGDGQRFE